MTRRAKPDAIAIYINPRFDFTSDHGEGGIKQVIGHVLPFLEARGCTFVDTPEAADVIWYHAAPYGTTKNYLAAHPEVPVVCSTHGSYWAEYQWGIAELNANADVIEAMRLADVVTAPSEWVANAVHRGLSADVRVVNHGVDPAEWMPPADGHDAYILVDKTRHEPGGVCDLAPVLALAEAMPDQRFVMCAAPEGPLPENVLALGRIPYEQARELTRKAALYLCVTRETFGLATLQAMAAGVPVVGWAFGGQAEIIEGSAHGGILVAEGHIGALADAVRETLQARTHYSGQAMKRAAEYTWDRAADLYMQAFRDAIAAHATPVRCTVIVAAYNAEATIRRTIGSALATMGPDDELIIVDDASTDGTRRALVEAKDVDPRARLIARPTNGYLAQARNDALRIARGRYVTCLDADDELTPGALDALAGELDKDRTTQIAYGKVRFIDDFPQPNGTIEEHAAEYGFGPGKSQWPFAFDWNIQNQGENVTCMPYSSMVRTAWLKRAGGWRTRCRTGEDLDLWMRLVSFGARPRMVTEADVLIYHTSTTSMSITNRLPEWANWYPWTDHAGKRSTPPFGLPFDPPPSMRVPAWPVSHHADPVVSVVIPVGPGHDRYVLDAVDSVMAQTYRRWECIVVDDTGSTLGIRLPGWVKLLEGSSSGGVAAARNAGTRAARAPYVVYLDADDWLERDALEHLVSAAVKNPGLAVVYPDYWERDPVGSGRRVTYQHTAHPLPDWDCTKAALPGAMYGITAIYRRDALAAVGGFDETAPGYEDGDLQVALTYAGYCAARLPRMAYIYNRWQGERREENRGRESAILEWMRAKYEGRESMACSSCGGSPARVSSGVMPPELGGDAVVLSGGMTSVAYTGERQGTFTLRGGSSGLFYNFGPGRDARKAVMNEDLAYFNSAPEFTVEADGPAQDPTKGPSLTVDGPPHGQRASVA